MTGVSLLVVTEEQKKEIREKVNVTEEQIEETVKTVKEWFSKQQHLPRVDLDPRVITNIFISRKGSVEQTKQKIDMMFTLRNLIPDLAAPRDVLDSRIQKCFKGCQYITLPKLNKDCTRVSIVVYKDPDYFNFTDLINFVCTLSEYRLVHDYFSGERYIIDMSGFTLNHLTKYTPFLLKKCETYIRNGFGMRVFGVHIINGSNLLNKLVAILKTGISEKIGGRIHAHPSFEDMYKMIDQDILPEEYKGNERSIPKLHEMWIEVLSRDENRKYLMELENLKSNEALRIGDRIDDTCFLGNAGSFRKIEVD